MAEPPVILFGPSTADDSWWAMLPSTRVLRARRVDDLLAEVERVMARQEPGRVFTFRLDGQGTGEPRRRRTRAKARLPHPRGA